MKQKILIISPQAWGAAMVSKHHYALALCRKGYEVYFVNPPAYRFQPQLSMRPAPEYEGLTIVDYTLPKGFGQLRARVPAVFTLLMRVYFALFMRSLTRIGFDMVWNFESNLFFDIRILNCHQSVYFPVDNVLLRNQRLSARYADLLVSLSPVIMEPIADFPQPKFLVNHGLGAKYAAHAKQSLDTLSPYVKPEKIKVGYVGNILIGVIDLQAFEAIIRQNPTVAFHIWGPFDPKTNTLGKAGAVDNQSFIDVMMESEHVHLYGVTHPDSLADQVQEMDAFLVCYDVNKDLNKGTSSHKILEYLSTGKVVISSNAPNYADKDEMLMMVNEKHNANLPELFKQVIEKIEYFNDIQHQQRRLAFALDNTYDKQTEKILDFCLNNRTKNTK